MRVWILVFDALGCYEETHALSNNGRESAAHFERPAKQALALATEPRVNQEARSVHTYQ